MLHRRAVVALAALFALVLAVLAGLAAHLAVERRTSELSRVWQPTRVLVAARDVAAGATLAPEDLTLGEVPRRLATASVVTADDAKGTPPVGRRLAFSLHAGDPLLWSHLAPRGTGSHLALAVLPRGRAVSIRVSPESSVHHAIEPGDRVDVIGVWREPRSGELATLTLLQNVLVLATGRAGGGERRATSDVAFTTVTLHVLPEAAELLVLAQELGTLYLTLRHPDDGDISDVGDGKTTVTTLLTGERSKRLSAVQSKIFRVEIIRGKHTETQTVP
jgi:pilus assembly protein CpaB